MPLYESIFIVRQDVSPQEVEKITEGFEKLIKDNKGKVAKREIWGLKSLAYAVSKNRKGHYILLGIETDGDTVKELQRQYKLHEDVIRYLTTKVTTISKKASPLAKKSAAEAA